MIFHSLHCDKTIPFTWKVFCLFMQAAVIKNWAHVRWKFYLRYSIGRLLWQPERKHRGAAAARSLEHKIIKQMNERGKKCNYRVSKHTLTHLRSIHNDEGERVSARGGNICCRQVRRVIHLVSLKPSIIHGRFASEVGRIRLLGVFGRDFPFFVQCTPPPAVLAPGRSKSWICVCFPLAAASQGGCSRCILMHATEPSSQSRGLKSTGVPVLGEGWLGLAWLRWMRRATTMLARSLMLCRRREIFSAAACSAARRPTDCYAGKRRLDHCFPRRK